MTFWATLLKLILSAPGEAFAGADSSLAEAAEAPLGSTFSIALRAAAFDWVIRP